MIVVNEIDFQDSYVPFSFIYLVSNPYFPLGYAMSETGT